jgi:hypothetical protein
MRTTSASRPPATTGNLETGPAPQFRRDCVLQPRVASRELPWVDGARRRQPQRGCGLARRLLNATTPLGLITGGSHFPRVARCSRPWALGRNPVGIRLPVRGAPRLKTWRGRSSKPPKATSMGDTAHYPSQRIRAILPPEHEFIWRVWTIRKDCAWRGDSFGGLVVQVGGQNQPGECAAGCVKILTVRH